MFTQAMQWITSHYSQYVSSNSIGWPRICEHCIPLVLCKCTQLVLLQITLGMQGAGPHNALPFFQPCSHCCRSLALPMFHHSQTRPILLAQSSANLRKRCSALSMFGKGGRPEGSTTVRGIARSPGLSDVIPWEELGQLIWPPPLVSM